MTTILEKATGKGEFIPGKIPGESARGHAPEGASSIGLMKITEAVQASQARRSGEAFAEDPNSGAHLRDHTGHLLRPARVVETSPRTL